MYRVQPVKPDADVRVASGAGGARGSASGRDEDDGNTIRVVAARTGFTQETLRAWERRYGFPRPERRLNSNRRVYSDEDTHRLVAIRRTLDRGYRVGDVIRKSLPELAALADPTDPEGPTARAELALPAALPETSVATLLDLLARDQVCALEAELRRGATALGPRRFVTDLAHPFAVRVGEAWAEGKLTVRHEHLATECLVTQLRHMLAGYQDIAARPLVLLATPPAELHTLALQLVATYLVVGGARPRLLGGPTPVADIVDSARVLEADVVGITISPGSHRKEARKAVRALRRGLPAHVPLWLGGGGSIALCAEGEGTHVMASWEAIDAGLSTWRRAPRAGARKAVALTR